MLGVVRKKRGLPRIRTIRMQKTGSLKLEAFFSPRDKVQVLLEAGQNYITYLKKNSPHRVIDDLADYVDIHGVRGSNGKMVDGFSKDGKTPKKEYRQWTSIVYSGEQSLNQMSDRHTAYINAELKKRGVPDHLLFDKSIEGQSSGWKAGYTNSITLENVHCAKDERGGKSTMSDQNGPIARIYADNDRNAQDGLRESDVKAFINSDPNNRVTISSWDRGFNALEKAGVAGTPLAQLQNDDDAEVRRVANRAIGTMFLNDQMGIVATRAVEKSDGSSVTKEVFGRFQFALQREVPGGVSGLLRTYEKLLALPVDKVPPYNVSEETGKPKEGLSLKAANTDLGFGSGAIVRGSSPVRAKASQARDKAKWSEASGIYNG